MSGLNISHFKSLIVIPTLQMIELYSDVAVNLLTGTALVESSLTYLKQLGSGPALGICQMEPATHDDCFKNFLNFRPDLLKKINAISGASQPSSSHLISNLAYSVALARIKYLRAKEPLPSNPNDAQALALYHKNYYNSSLGSADISKNIPLFKIAINAQPQGVLA